MYRTEKNENRYSGEKYMETFPCVTQMYHLLYSINPSVCLNLTLNALQLIKISFFFFHLMNHLIKFTYLQSIHICVCMVE